MQLLNNYLKFRRYYNKKKGFKFHYHNYKLLNNLEFLNKDKVFNNNKINIKGRYYIKYFIKTLNNLKKFNFKSPSTFNLRIIMFFLLSKNISFMFYKAI